MTSTGRCGSHREMSAVSCPISVGRLELNELPSMLLRRPTTGEAHAKKGEPVEDGLCCSCSRRSTTGRSAGSYTRVRLVSCPSSLGRLPVNALPFAAL